MLRITYYQMLISIFINVLILNLFNKLKKETKNWEKESLQVSTIRKTI